MNKYMGFYELKDINIPTIPWRQFTHGIELNRNLLWTVRVAVLNSNDLNLPRFVGVTADEAMQKGEQLLIKYGNNGLIIYYPYFIATKSGVIDMNYNRTIIEAVKKDLWNLVTYGNKDVTIKFQDNDVEYIGDKNFIEEEELQQLRKYENIVKLKYRDIVNEGSSILLEWSFAYNTNIKGEPLGEKYLVFYELRSV